MVRFEDGRIVTDLGDCALFELIWRKWAKRDETEIEAFWAKMTTQEMTDEWLKNEGFTFYKKSCFLCDESICLIKVGFREWTIKDASVKEVEVFVRKLVARRKREELVEALAW